MQLGHLRNRLHSMKSTIQDEDYVAHILSNLTEEYSELVTVLEVELETITVDKLKERVRGFYRRKGSKKYTKDVNHALLHTFKGKCHMCGVYGHKQNKCPNKYFKKSERKARNLCCKYCKRNGHSVDDCYKLKSLKKFESKGNGEWHERKKIEREVALVAKTSTILTKDEIWYADSGASKHMTADPEGLFD